MPGEDAGGDAKQSYASPPRTKPLGLLECTDTYGRPREQASEAGRESHHMASFHQPRFATLTVQGCVAGRMAVGEETGRSRAGRRR